MVTSATNSLRKVDESLLRTSAGATIILLLLAFVLNSPALVAIVALAQLLGAINSPFSPYRFLYARVIKPSGLVQPHVIEDNPEPHRFALLLGGIFNTLATILFLVGAPVVGWVLVWIVIALANLNFWINLCVGCLMYYQLNRLGVPGFRYAPVK